MNAPEKKMNAPEKKMDAFEKEMDDPEKWMGGFCDRCSKSTLLAKSAPGH